MSTASATQVQSSAMLSGWLLPSVLKMTGKFHLTLAILIMIIDRAFTLNINCIEKSVASIKWNLPLVGYLIRNFNTKFLLYRKNAANMNENYITFSFILKFDFTVYIYRPPSPCIISNYIVMNS